jgi:hypothetical protein
MDCSSFLSNPLLRIDLISTYRQKLFVLQIRRSCTPTMNDIWIFICMSSQIPSCSVLPDFLSSLSLRTELLFKLVRMTQQLINSTVVSWYFSTERAHLSLFRFSHSCFNKAIPSSCVLTFGGHLANWLEWLCAWVQSSRT